MSEKMWIRQKELNLRVPKKAVVLGVGGVGSWVAYFLARLGVKELVICDPDEIEEHNLNRTPFTLEHVGMKKVEAMEEIIYSFRDDIDVKTIPEYVLDWRKEFEDADVIIDARDTTSLLPFRTDFKLTYDGEMITVWVKPSEFITIGENSGYITVPSYIVPPVILAGLVVHIISMMDWENLKPTVVTKTVTKIVREVGL